MKKLVAIILTVAMLASCVPVMAFAEEPEPEKTREEEFVENTEKELNDLLAELLKDEGLKDFLTSYLWLSDEFQAYKDQVDDFAKALDSEDPAKVLEQLEVFRPFLDEYIEEGRAYAEKLKDDPEVQAAVERLLSELDDLSTFLEGQGYDVDDYYPASLFDIDDQIRKAYEDAAELLNKEFVMAALDFVLDKAGEIAKEQGADEAKVEEILEQVEALIAIADYYASMGRDEAIDAMINDAYEMLMIIAQEYLNDGIDELEKYLEEQGVDDEELKAFLEEIRDIDVLIEKLEALAAEVSEFDINDVDFDKLMDDCEELIREFLEEHEEEIEAVIQEMIEKCQEILEEKGITEEDIAVLIEIIQQLKELAEQYKGMDPEAAINDLIERAKAYAEEALCEALEQLIDKAEEIIKEQGITEETIKEIMDAIRQIRDIVDEYKSLTPDEIMDKLIEEANALIEEYRDEIEAAVLDYALDLIERVSNGEFDEYLAPTGMTGSELVDLIEDVIAYAAGLSEGEGYLDVKAQLLDALLELDDAKAELSEKIDEIETITRVKDAEIENLKEQVKAAEGNTEVIKQFINGNNVSKKKPALKKVKAAKNKKVKVTFKGLKGAEVQKYQISYKTGKKAKSKTWKKATTSAKALNYTLKKLKKGKKYTIKVRAIYSFKFNGKTYKFVSKWSKAKKVKKVK